MDRRQSAGIETICSRIQRAWSLAVLCTPFPPSKCELHQKYRRNLINSVVNHFATHDVIDRLTPHWLQNYTTGSLWRPNWSTARPTASQPRSVGRVQLSSYPLTAVSCCSYRQAGIPRRRRSSPTRPAHDFLKLFLWQAERHADILVTILVRMSARKYVSVSVSVPLSAPWNASYNASFTKLDATVVYLRTQ